MGHLSADVDALVWVLSNLIQSGSQLLSGYRPFEGCDTSVQFHDAPPRVDSPRLSALGWPLMHPRDRAYGDRDFPRPWCVRVKLDAARGHRHHAVPPPTAQSRLLAIDHSQRTQKPPGPTRASLPSPVTYGGTDVAAEEVGEKVEHVRSIGAASRSLKPSLGTRCFDCRGPVSRSLAAPRRACEGARTAPGILLLTGTTAETDGHRDGTVAVLWVPGKG